MRSLKTTSGHSEMTSQFVTQHSETNSQKECGSCQRLQQLLKVTATATIFLVHFGDTPTYCIACLALAVAEDGLHRPELYEMDTYEYLKNST